MLFILMSEKQKMSVQLLGWLKFFIQIFQYSGSGIICTYQQAKKLITLPSTVFLRSCYLSSLMSDVKVQYDK
jgi:hypothetical protein